VVRKTLTSLLEESMTALDGMVAAFIGDSVVSSPNSEFVPEIPRGTAEVYLREDLRYGPDDATIWPQPFLESHPFLAIIPRKPVDREWDRWIMWWLPTMDDFEQNGDMHLGGVGLLAGTNMDLLVSMVRELLGLTREQLVKRNEEETHRFIKATYATLTHTFVRLTSYAASFEEKCLEVSECQRSWLEHWAAVNFYNKVQKMMETNTDAPLKAREVVGCFTASVHFAQQCFCAGIPVWLIRNYKALLGGTVRIDKKVEFTKLVDKVALKKRATFQYPVIYKGARDNEARYTEQQKFMRSRFVSRNPWDEDINPLNAGDDGLESKTRSMEELARHPTRVVKSTSSARMLQHPCEYMSSSKWWRSVAEFDKQMPSVEPSHRNRKQKVTR
jgi:hypothetical protein